MVATVQKQSHFWKYTHWLYPSVTKHALRTRTHTHSHTYTHIHLQIHTHMHTHAYTNAHAHTSTNTLIVTNKHMMRTGVSGSSIPPAVPRPALPCQNLSCSCSTLRKKTSDARPCCCHHHHLNAATRLHPSAVSHFASPALIERAAAAACRAVLS